MISNPAGRLAGLRFCFTSGGTPGLPLGVPADLNPARHPIKSPARRPGGFAIRRKKRFDLLNRGICNPPTKGNAFSFAADFKSAEPK